MFDPPLHYTKEERPWGFFERFTENDLSTVKIITIRANEAFSLQKHGKRDEFWKIISGSGTVTIGNEKKEAGPDKTFFIPRGTLHRGEAGSDDLVFLEISFGEFDENDIIRIDDRYNRV